MNYEITKAFDRLNTNKGIRYAELRPMDITNGEGICVSLFVQGCPHHCKGCFNPETWDFEGGKESTSEKLKDEIIRLLGENGIKRNLSVLGGEPLCLENVFYVDYIISEVKKEFPEITIYLWTGYTDEELFFNRKLKEEVILLSEEEIILLKAQLKLLKKVDVLIEGRYEEDKKDPNLKLRGSYNQKVYKRISGKYYRQVDW